MLASQSGYVQCAAMLLTECGLADRAYNTALIHAAKKGSVEIVRMLAGKETRRANKHGESALMITCYRGFADCAHHLIEEAGMVDNTKQTALMIAARRN